MGELQIYNNEEFGDIRTVTIENEVIIAWMPLPEPYREGK